MRDRILELLKNSDGYLSGETISTVTGISRTAVWKHIQQLRQAGYQIDAKTNRGYLLREEADIFTEQAITHWFRQTGSQWVNKLIYEQATASTNTLARQAAERKAPDRTLCVTERQTAGRGRRGRTWLSDAQNSLTFSVLFRPQTNPGTISSITLLAGLAVSEALNNLLNQAILKTDQNTTFDKPLIQIKWPNDLIASKSNRKIGGLLTETLLEENRVDALIIGIGINLNQSTFPEDLQQLATSMKSDYSVVLKRLDVLGEIMHQLDTRYRSLADRESWLTDYRAQCMTLGRPVRVINQSKTIMTGVARDINEAGELIIEQADGKRIAVYAGEVSVRGMSDYNS